MGFHLCFDLLWHSSHFGSSRVRERIEEAHCHARVSAGAVHGASRHVQRPLCLSHTHGGHSDAAVPVHHRGFGLSPCGQVHRVCEAKATESIILLVVGGRSHHSSTEREAIFCAKAGEN